MLDGDKRMSLLADSADPVVVCGAGAAGMAAALSAARHGSPVSLIEADLQSATEVVIEHSPCIVDGQQYDVSRFTIEAHEVDGSSLLLIEGLL